MPLTRHPAPVAAEGARRVRQPQAPSPARQPDVTRDLSDRIHRHLARIGVVGLGHAGLPLAIAFARAGFCVSGIDTNAIRVAAIRAGESPVTSVPAADVRSLVNSGGLSATDRADVLAGTECIVICVPTPVTSDGQADLHLLKEAARSVGRHLRAGTLVVLESTCPAGTTRRVVAPILEEASGLRAGDDFYLGFAPERIDPGNQTFGIHNTPQLASGITATCREYVCALFGQIVERVVPVSSTEVAETAKLFENTFRFVNIGLVNQMAMLCDELGISVWDVVDAAATKPFGFLPHYPGPGIGGECIPVVPFFLSAAARELGVPFGIVEAAAETNAQMPSFVLGKLDRLLRDRGKELRDATVLLLGMAYKRDSTDLRHSPAVRVLDALLDAGVAVDYTDPHVPVVLSTRGEMRSLSQEQLAGRRFDCAVLLTPHTAFDYVQIVRRVGFIFDTRNGLAGSSLPNVISL